MEDRGYETLRQQGWRIDFRFRGEQLKKPAGKKGIIRTKESEGKIESDVTRSKKDIERDSLQGRKREGRL